MKMTLSFEAATAAELADLLAQAHQNFNGNAAPAKAAAPAKPTPAKAAAPTAAKEAEDETPTLDTIRAVAAEKIAGGKQAEVKALLVKYGATKLGDLAMVVYSDFMADVKAL